MALTHIVKGADKLDRWMGKLDRLCSELRELAAEEYGADVDVEEAMRCLDAMRRNVARSVPVDLCLCRAGLDCPHCRGRKWVTAKRMESSSDAEGSC